MPKPIVAIVGRPNVGKSTLFNRLVGRRSALVDDRPGVTRDRREGDASLLGLEFTIVDTAGFEDEDAITLPGRMRVQTEAAVRAADVALFLIDAREGLTSLDEEIGRWLRAESTPVIVAANKAEGRGGEAGRLEAYKLGLGDPLALSAEHGEGLVDLFEALRPHVEREGAEAEARGRGRGGRAAQAGDRRAAQRGQVDPGQHHARRGTDDHRARSRDHARFDQPRLGVAGQAGAAGRHRGPAQARQGRRQDWRNCRRSIPAGRSTMPRSSCCCSTPRAGWKCRI